MGTNLYIYFMSLITWIIEFYFGYQGALAQRRSNFQGNQFPVTTEVARKAAVAPLRGRPFVRNGLANPDKARYYIFLFHAVHLYL